MPPIKTKLRLAIAVRVLLSAAIATTLSANIFAADDNAEFHFAQAQRLASENAGDPDFDWYFAQSTIAVDRCDLAIFALERILVANPGDLRARTELGRCYHRTGQYHQAQALFEEVISHDIPQPVARKVHYYLDDIDHRKSLFEPSINYFVTAEAGHDNNINSGINQSSLDIPGLGTVDLSPDSQAVSSSYNNLKIGAEGRHAFNKNKALSANIAISVHNNTVSDNFDTQQISLNLSYYWREGTDRYSIGVSHKQLELGDKDYFNSTALLGQWITPLSSDVIAIISAQLSDNEYQTSSEDFRDNMRIIGAANVVYDYALWRFNLGMYIGHENGDDATGDFAQRDLMTGLSANIVWQAGNTWSPFLSLQYSRFNYAATHPIFQEERRDTQALSQIGVIWLPVRGVSVSPTLEHSQNDSNISAYNYNRTQARVGLSYSF